MKKIALCLLVLFTTTSLTAQTLYAIMGGNKIYRINADNSITYLSTPTVPEGLFGDIAIAPSGEMYGVTSSVLYHINPLTGVVTYIAQLPSYGYNALVCSNDYELYTIGIPDENLYKYNLLTNTLTTVAYMGYDPSGDLAFYKGNLICQTLHENGQVYTIKAYNPETGTLKDLFCDVNPLNFFGMVSVFNDCGDETVYASNDMGNFFIVDFDNQTYNQQPIQFPDDEIPYGLASTNEYLGSDCTPQDLEDLECALAVNSNKISDVIVYPNPAAGVLHFKNYQQVKSVTVYDVTGKQVKAINKSVVSGIDINDLAAGLYVLKIGDGENYSIRKIVKE
ncbi:T9SS type A sorting domain-containing protein [Flavobacterium sp. RHBU_24]|uniref:T9SS type A sorting domain-containing protein n=1 Tax=Flavobacterium sp. RHBU_24 TaxID=3391185 RepID=UPI0039854760